MKARKKPLKMPAWPKSASVFEVGPRDGLQAEGKILGVDDRLALILKLASSGLKDIEVGSFVKADWIPQLQNMPELLAKLNAALPPSAKRPRFWAFIPNEYGLNRAIENKLDGVSVFIATSNTFCLKNVNRTQAQLLDEIEKLIKAARKAKVKSRVYLSTLVHCPYEGVIDPKKVLALVKKIAGFGATEIALSDTTGHATPLSMRKVLELVLKDFPPGLFAVHLHDTRGLALANIIEAMNFGVSRFDSSIGGLGGCPYAPGATGNLSTEDLVYMLRSMKLEKSIDLKKLAEAGYYAEQLLGKKLPSRVLHTLGAK